MATRKGRRMTAREKKLAAEVRAEMRDKGLLPEKKKPLNRKKFVDQARAVLGESIGYDTIPYLLWALSEMLGHRAYLEASPDLEAVGAAKVILLAKRRMDFEKEQIAAGREKWTIGELCEAVQDVYRM